MRQALDSTGQIATRCAYDPFGVLLAGDGVPNPWQFTGESWDAEVELLYLRARYYQPEAGRFVTKDPWPGGVWRPSTLNRRASLDMHSADNSVRTRRQDRGCRDIKESYSSDRAPRAV